VIDGEDPGISGFAAAGMPRAARAGMTPSSALVALAIPALAVVVVTLVGVGIGIFAGARSARRYALAAAAWLGSTGLLALLGFWADFDARPPHLPLLVLPALGLPTLLAFSRTGTRLAHGVPIALLVGFQAFRLPLELVMHQAAVEGTMPPQMTYTGSNFDIVTGISAAVVGAIAAWGHAPRWLLLAWNTLGTALLIAILVIAVASLPTFQAFGSDPSLLNTWVAYFPFVWLPAGLVSAAVLGHLLLWRRLLGAKEVS
jgi:hypothetical protein